MILNAFVDQPTEPTDAELSAVLGPARELWDTLLAHLAREHDVTVQEWKSYSRKAGWSLRLKRRDRVIVYLSPGRGCFTASFALGDKVVRAARDSRIPPRVLKIIDAAKRYVEFTAVRLDVTKAADVEIMERLAVIKLNH